MSALEPHKDSTPERRGNIKELMMYSRYIDRKMDKMKKEEESDEEYDGEVEEVEEVDTSKLKKGVMEDVNFWKKLPHSGIDGPYDDRLRSLVVGRMTDNEGNPLTNAKKKNIYDNFKIWRKIYNERVFNKVSLEPGKLGGRRRRRRKSRKKKRKSTKKRRKSRKKRTKRRKSKKRRRRKLR